MDTVTNLNRAFNFGLMRYLNHGHENLARRLKGVVNWKDVSDYALGRKPLSAYVARRVEETLKLPSGWLDRDHRHYLEACDDLCSLFVLACKAPAHVRAAIVTILNHAPTVPVEPMGESGRRGLTLVTNKP